MIRAPLIAVTLSIAGGTVTACGGSTRPARARARPAPVATRVCPQARQAAAMLLRPVNRHIADRDPANIECLVSGQGITVDMVAQASPRAWTQYDTTVVHLVQAFGSGSAHQASELPHQVRGVGLHAVWIPGQHELLTTNGTESTGGSYLTGHHHPHHASGGAQPTAGRVVAKAGLASAPRGPSPGPPPS